MSEDFGPELNKLYNNCRRMLKGKATALRGLRREDLFISTDGLHGPRRPELYELIAFLLKHQHDSSLRNNPLFFKSYCLLHELYDYWDMASCLAQLPLEHEIVNLQRDLERGVQLAPDLWKERIRLISVHANNLYRQGEYKKALRELQRGEAALLSKVGSSDSVLGGLRYVTAKIKRQQGKYRECEYLFAQACSCYANMADSPGRSEEGRLLAEHKGALAWGGLARSQARRGSTVKAQAMVEEARWKLRGSPWRLSQAHLDLIYADILRTNAGSDVKQLNKAIKIARPARDVFSQAQHLRLESRATFLLGLLHYYSNELAEAKAAALRVTRFAREQNNSHWELNGLLLQARVHLKRGDAANAIASLAGAETMLEESRGNIAPDQKAEYHIVRGESFASLRDVDSSAYQKAHDCFNKALKVLRASPENGAFRELNQKTLGWVYLNLTELSLWEGKYVAAKQNLNRWQELDAVEPRWLHERATQLEKQLGEFKDAPFVHEIDKKRWSLTEATEEFARWYARQAALHLGTDTPAEVAALIGVGTSRATRFLKKEGAPPAKRGRKPKRGR